MLVGYALLPLIVAALLWFGLRWKSDEMALLVLLLTICEVSLVPPFHQSTTHLASTLAQGLLLALRESMVWLPALLFVYVQYATHTCQLVIQLLARLVPSRELLSLLLVFGVGPCLTSWGGAEVALLLLLPLLVCLHQDRTRAMTMGLLSLLSSPGSIVMLITPVSMQVYGETLLLLAPVLMGTSLTVVWLSHRANPSGWHWGTALLVAGLTSTTAWLFGHLLPRSAVGMGTGTVVIALLFLRARMLARPSASPSPAFTRQHTIRALLPYALLCIGFCLSTLFSFSLPLSMWSTGLWLGLGTVILLRFTPLRPVHLTRVSTLAARQALPIVATLSCLVSTVLLMEQSGMGVVLAHTLELTRLDASWMASLSGALQGWFLQTDVPVIIPAIHTPSSSWIVATQLVTAVLTAAVAPVTLLLAKAVTGVTEPEVRLLARVGRFLLWALSVITLLATSLAPSIGWLRIGALAGFCLLLLLPLLARKDRMQRPSLHHSVLTLATNRPSLLRGWLAPGALVLVNVLYASSSLVSLGPLSRLDPTIFLCFQVLLLVPPGLLLLRSAALPLTRAQVLRGMQLGACLAAGLLCVALSLKETGVLETTIFSGLNGVIAMLIARWLFGQRLSRWSWGAASCLLLGAFLVWLVAPLHWQSNILAFVAGFLLTCDGFQVERLLSDYGPHEGATIRAIVGVQCVAMAGFATVVALCFGHWQTLHLLVPSDLLALCYLSAGTILLPCLLMLWAQRSLNAVTVACGSVIEPCVTMGASVLLSGQRIPPLALLGSGVVFMGIVLQLLGSITIPSTLE